MKEKFNWILPNDDLISEVSLYRESPLLLRLDVFPFLIGYLICIISIFIQFGNDNDDEEESISRLIPLALFPILLITHLILFILAQSSVSFRALLGKKKVYQIEHANYILISARKNKGKDKLVPLLRNRTPMELLIESFGNNIPENFVKLASNKKDFVFLSNDYKLSTYSFNFQEIVYNFDSEDGYFKKNEYIKIKDIESFFSWKGFSSPLDLFFSLAKWNQNEFNFPLPHFLDLFLENLIAPFFIFQVFCLFLWSLDDYWYYSLSVFFLLLIFESIMCNQKRNNYLLMRSMRRPPFQLYVFRGNGWVPCESNNIFPGDLISIVSSDTETESNENRVVPCDIMLLKGTCVVNEAMLTGESVPKMKESITLDHFNEAKEKLIEKNSTDDEEIFSFLSRNILLGGTQIQQHSSESNIDLSNSYSCKIPSPPDNGCIGVVLRTGFGTTQGELMRKIIFSNDGISNTSSETYFFILILILFALIASSYVLKISFFDPRRNKFRIILHCIMIITSVVPPELPMELSLSITNSVTSLSKLFIFSTEPFRIPFAGRIDCICFDKTGTLTKDEMLLKGVVAPRTFDLIDGTPEEFHDELSEDIMVTDGVSELVKTIMGVCHDLLPPKSNEKDPLGDPLEIASFKSSTFSFNDNSDINSHSLSSSELLLNTEIIHKFPFSSDLKRMSVAVTLNKFKPFSLPVGTTNSIFSSFSTSSSNVQLIDSKKVSYIFTKGAPEVLLPLLKFVPPGYTHTYQKHMKSGKRVLALAYKTMPDLDPITKILRTDAESSLYFAGFLVFDSDLKGDSKSVIKELRASSHNIMMITGDSIYTAINVSKRLNLIPNSLPVLILVLAGKSSKDSFKQKQFIWRYLDDLDETNIDASFENDIQFDLEKISELSKSYSLAITGESIKNFSKYFCKNLDDVSIESSTNILPEMKKLFPHISVFARVSPLEKEKIIICLNETGLFTLMCGDGTNDIGALRGAHVGVSIINNPLVENKIEKKIKKESKNNPTNKKDRLNRALEEIKLYESDPTIVKLGDASIASPFTSKRTSIECVLSILRIGRSTLVASIQVYKVLALNCLSSAFMMSILYLKGLKQGDFQMTCMGLIITILFFFISQAKPLQTLSEKRPPYSVFNKSVFLSIFLQFTIHLISMYSMLTLCEKYSPINDNEILDGKFTPNLFNSVMFLLTIVMQLNNFFVNYRGPPFMESFFSNVALSRLVIGIYIVVLIAIGGHFEPLNDLLQLVRFSDQQFQSYVIFILLFNGAGNYIVEQLCRKLE